MLLRLHSLRCLLGIAHSGLLRRGLPCHRLGCAEEVLRCLRCLRLLLLGLHLQDQALLRSLLCMRLGLLQSCGLRCPSPSPTLSLQDRTEF